MDDEYPYSQFQIHNCPVTFLTSSPSGKLVLAGFEDGKIKVLNLQNNVRNEEMFMNLTDTISTVSKKITSINFNLSTNLNEILLSSGNTITQFDYHKSESIRRITDDRSWLINNNCNYLNSDLVAAIDNDNSLKLYDLKNKSNKPVQVFRNSTDSLTCFDFKKQRNWFIACGTNDGNIFSYDLRMEKLIIDKFASYINETKNHSNEKYPITSVSLSDGPNITKSSSKYALIGSLHNQLKLMDLDIGSLTQSSTKFISNYNEYSINRDISNLQLRQDFDRKIPDKSYQIEAKIFNTDKNVISGSETGEVYVWNFSNPKKGKDNLILKTYNNYMINETQSNKLLLNVSHLRGVNCVLAGGGDGKLHLWENVNLN